MVQDRIQFSTSSSVVAGIRVVAMAEISKTSNEARTKVAQIKEVNNKLRYNNL